MRKFEEQEYNKRFDPELWKKLFHFIKEYKKELLVVAVVMVGVAGIDTIFPLMTKYAVDNFVIPGTTKGVLLFSLVYLGLVMIQSINVFLFIIYAGKVEMGISYDIREAGFRKLQELALSYFDRTAVGWLMARMTSDIRKLGETISWGLVDMVWGSAKMIAIMGVMLVLNLKLALITLTVVPLLVLLSIYFQKKILTAYRKVRKINSKITGAFNEGIMGARTTKTLVREEENLKEFQRKTTRMRSSSIRVAIFSSLFLPLVLTLASIGTALALWAGGSSVIAGTMTYGTLVAFLSYTIRFFEPVRELARVFAELQSAQASAERVLSLLDAEVEVEDTEEVISKYGDQFNPCRENWPDIKGRITFDGVCFSYKDGETVLEDFNLDIKPGETIALVGETGSGKSTIANLACRFYEPSSGRILIDGVDYRKRSQLWLHDNLGYVLQSPHLFSGTIKENIRYGNLEAGDLDIVKAAKLVNAHQFINKLDKGYDSEVGESGDNLSTGEKQLISFARAVISDPGIFVLDEATSSIDTEMEQIIQQAIEKILEGRTNIIIAHRLSTIRTADRILVIRDGQIVEDGSHQQLLRKEGYYHRLYSNQFRTKSVSGGVKIQ